MDSESPDTTGVKIATYIGGYHGEEYMLENKLGTVKVRRSNTWSEDGWYTSFKACGLHAKLKYHPTKLQALAYAYECLGVTT
jgi:hypothetical protein